VREGKIVEEVERRKDKGGEETEGGEDTSSS